MDFESFSKDFSAYLDSEEGQKKLKELEAQMEETKKKARENTAHLLKCPCCGGNPLRGKSPDSWGEWDIIYCEDCGLTAPSEYDSCDEVWQRRITPN